MILSAMTPDNFIILLSKVCTTMHAELGRSLEEEERDVGPSADLRGRPVRRILTSQETLLGGMGGALERLPKELRVACKRGKDSFSLSRVRSVLGGPSVSSISRGGRVR
ncbi:hypothetical protein V1478_013581 [Vespula squamosa]|uniref:Uncharacterized protein n=1 Tax=Vespula squamosa TaxID=30214 RepID=A0ABD2A5L8_VESSQ